MAAAGTSPGLDESTAQMLAIEDLPILLVDDEPEVLRALERSLASRRWRLVSCSSSREALALVERQEFAAVVCDYRMPEMDGVELLSRVRARWPAAERILLTACADQEALERGINDAGVNRLLRKPWRAKLLVSVLEQALEQCRMRREHAVLLERVHNRNEELVYLNRLLRDRVAESDRAINTFHRRWDAALNAISEPIVIVSGELRIEGANATAGRLAGRAPEELEGRRCHEVLFGNLGRCAGCPVDSGQGRITFERDGAERVYEATAYPLSSDRDAFLCGYRDLTHRLAFEREAAHVEKMAAIGRVAGSVAHELNNPLHAILTFVQLAQKPEVPPEKLARYHEVIRESAIRCRDIVQSLRNFSRRETPAEDRAIDLDVVCDKALVLFTRLRDDKRVDRAPAAAGGAWCLGNANRYQQVVINLIQNAVDASPERGVVRVGVAAEGDEIVLAVEDQGPGVPESERHKIFEPFYTTKPEGMGTGLGLAISHQIVREHGGCIRVGSAAAGGARFEVRLPRAAGPTAHDTEPDSARSMTSNTGGAQ